MSLYVNKQHILYSQPVSSSTAWMCLWTTHHYILKKNKKNPSTFVCLCNICFNSVNCLCLVGSDHKIWMIWDYFGDIYGSADSWFLYLRTHVTLSFCPHYNWAAIINLDLVSDAGVWKQQNFQGCHYRHVSHIPSWSFWFVPLAVGNIYSQLCHRMIIPAWHSPWAKYCANIRYLSLAEHFLGVNML